VLEEPTYTSVPSPVTIVVGGVVVHQCDEHELITETVARRVGALLRDADG
jgi:hypothetical protein